MERQQFNLVTQPWIKVIDNNSYEQTVSLIELFQNTANYRQLVGEMRTQDLAVLRFLLAVLTTVYSRYDADGNPYEWLDVDKDTMINSPNDMANIDDLIDTWDQLYENGKFSQIVLDYLELYADKFDLLSEEYPFYQVTKEQYDSLVPISKAVAKGKGTVAVKQMNRTISESNNSRAIFSPTTGQGKNRISLDELARWLITYQNFTGVTDKTKVNAKDKFSISKGWLYSINPVIAEGQNLFETLMLNLVLGDVNLEDTYHNQHPVWEYDNIENYIDARARNILPDNRAELYTIWSRVLHIEWDTNGQPTIFSAGLPSFEIIDNNLEPNTTWKQTKKKAEIVRRPESQYLGSLNKAMWRSFGHYVRTSTDEEQESRDTKPPIPGIVLWLNRLKDEDYIPENKLIELDNIAMVSDGNATSQSPAAEVIDSMRLEAGVLFDSNEDKRMYWPDRIEDVIELTQQVGDYYYLFAKNIGEMRNLSDPASFAAKLSAQFYERLNEPFNDWLASLRNNQERDHRVNEWKETVLHIARDAAQEMMQNSTIKDARSRNKKIKGKDQDVNIFTYNRIFNIQVNRTLALENKK